MCATVQLWKSKESLQELAVSSIKEVLDMEEEEYKGTYIERNIKGKRQELSGVWG